eukprot:872982-Pleurochrysis_carterae.AAC.1
MIRVWDASESFRCCWTTAARRESGTMVAEMAKERLEERVASRAACARVCSSCCKEVLINVVGGAGGTKMRLGSDESGDGKGDVSSPSASPSRYAGGRYDCISVDSLWPAFIKRVGF